MLSSRAGSRRRPGPLRRAALATLLWLLASGCDSGDRGSEGVRASASVQSPAAAPAGAPAASARTAQRNDAGADATPPEEKAERFVIVAGGDVNLGRGLGQQLIRGEDVNPFRVIEPILKSADLRFVNLESQLSDQGGETQSPRNPLIFTGPPQGADLLARVGIDIVSLANNHAWDYGREALFDTVANLRRVGVAYVGASEKKDQMYEPAILRKKGWSVAWFAVTHIWNHGAFKKHRAKRYVAWARFDLLESKLKQARREHDIVLVSYHGGYEYMDVPHGGTREFVRAVMNAKADAVIGHHPHIPHGVGWFGDRPALYSLGNLVFHMHRDYSWTGTGFLARLTFSQGATGIELQVEACPYHIHWVTPMLFDGKHKSIREKVFKRHLELISVTVGRTQVGEPGEHSCMRLQPPEPKRRRRSGKKKKSKQR